MLLTLLSTTTVYSTVEKAMFLRPSYLGADTVLEAPVKSLVQQFLPLTKRNGSPIYITVQYSR